MMRKMVSLMQQGLIFGYHITFKNIPNDNDKCILCNLSKKRDEVLEIQDDLVLKDLEDFTIEQKDAL